MMNEQALLKIVDNDGYVDGDFEFEIDYAVPDDIIYILLSCLFKRNTIQQCTPCRYYEYTVIDDLTFTNQMNRSN